MFLTGGGRGEEGRNDLAGSKPWGVHGIFLGWGGGGGGEEERKERGHQWFSKLKSSKL